MIYCSKCNYWNIDGEKECKNCGEKLIQNQTNNYNDDRFQNQQAQQNYQKPQKKNNSLLKIPAVQITMAIMLGVFFAALISYVVADLFIMKGGLFDWENGNNQNTQSYTLDNDKNNDRYSEFFKKTNNNIHEKNAGFIAKKNIEIDENIKINDKDIDTKNSKKDSVDVKSDNLKDNETEHRKGMSIFDDADKKTNEKKIKVKKANKKKIDKSNINDLLPPKRHKVRKAKKKIDKKNKKPVTTKKPISKTKQIKQSIKPNITNDSDIIDKDMADLIDKSKDIKSDNDVVNTEIELNINQSEANYIIQFGAYSRHDFALERQKDLASVLEVPIQIKKVNNKFYILTKNRYNKDTADKIVLQMSQVGFESFVKKVK